jgi:phosphohistidine phosphatase
MKRLILLRHAKSSWDESRREDFDRPLAPRGKRAADAMAGYLAREGLVPDLVLCSAAKRAVDTWKRLAPKLGGTVAVRIEPALYLAEAHALLDRLRRAPGDVSSMLLIGHNPGLHALARFLAGDGDDEARARLAAKFPTAALAVIDVDAAQWSKLGRHDGRLARFVTPKDLD